MSVPSGVAAATARNLMLDSQLFSTSSQEQEQNHYPSGTQQGFLSSGSTVPYLSDPNWRDNVLSGPSTMAPSPPVPMLDIDRNPGGGDTSLVGVVPGSARALARMIHFSNNSSNNHAAASSADSLDQRGGGSETTGVAAASLSASSSSGSNAAAEVDGSGVGSWTASPTGVGGREGGCAKAIGSWMASSDDYNQYKPCTAAGTPTEGECVIEDGEGGIEQESTSGIPGVDDADLSGRFDNTETSGGWVSNRGATGQGELSEEQDEQDVFVMKPSEEHGGGSMAPLLGVWRVFQSQGYPYYLHEASGHSQWEDPRGREGDLRPRDLSTMAAKDATADLGAGSDSRSEARGRAVDEGQDKLKDDQITANAIPTKKDWESIPPASPITPTGVPVVVTVSQFVDVPAVPRTPEELSAENGGAAASESSEGGERESGKGASVSVLGESACRAGLHRDSNGSNGGYSGSIDSGLMESKNIESDGASSPPNNADEVTVNSEDENNSNNSAEGCHHDVENNLERGGSHRSAGVSNGWDARGKSERKGTDKRIKDKLSHDVDEDDRCSLLADRVDNAASDGGHRVGGRSPDSSAEDDADLVGGHDRTGAGSKYREEDEHDEQWWQELDDETVDETKHEGGSSKCR